MLGRVRDEKLIECREVEWLDEMMVETGFSGTAPILGLTPTGDRHHDHAVAAGKLP
jgi:hypothetical protein